MKEALFPLKKNEQKVSNTPAASLRSLTPERAEYLVENTSYDSIKYAFVDKNGCNGRLTHEDGMTLMESKYVMKVWDTLEGNTSFMTAVNLVRSGNCDVPQLTDVEINTIIEQNSLSDASSSVDNFLKQDAVPSLNLQQ